MIIIAIVRAAASELPGGVTDTAWLFFWQTMEAAVAIITVSVMVSKALLGQNTSGFSKGTLLNGNEGHSHHETDEHKRRTKQNSY